MIIMHDHRPSHPYNAVAEHVGFSSTRQTPRTHLLLALVSWPLTTHPFPGRSAIPVLLIETPPTIGRSFHFRHTLLEKIFVRGHHLSRRIAIVCSLRSSVWRR